MKPFFLLLDGFLQGVCYINNATALAFFTKKNKESTLLFCFFFFPPAT